MQDAPGATQNVELCWLHSQPDATSRRHVCLRFSVMKPNQRGPALAIGLLVLMVLITFARSFLSDLVLFTTDDPLGQLHYWKDTLPHAWIANWSPDNLVGMGNGQASFT